MVAGWPKVARGQTACSSRNGRCYLRSQTCRGDTCMVVAGASACPPARPHGLALQLIQQRATMFHVVIRAFDCRVGVNEG